MFLRVVLFLVLFTSLAFSQNNVIIFSSNGTLFQTTINGIECDHNYLHEFKVSGLTQDTLEIFITSAKEGLKLKRTIFLLEKGVPVKNKEFIYALEQNSEAKKLKLAFLNAYDITQHSKLILPEKPAIDTSFKWHNNVFGTLFELKNGKPIFYYNIPKNNACTEGMNEVDLKHGLAYLGRTTIGLEKYDYAKEMVKNNCITCKQLSAILLMIEFELDKLKLVKDAYVNLVDKKDLNTLKSCFRFESSKNEFENMLANPTSMVPERNKINCSKPVPDSLVVKLSSDIKLFATDHERFQFMKEKASSYCITSIQFKGILELFVHDREKLDLTKQFYFNLTDKENIGIINDVFSYKESVINLESFLKSN